MAKGVYFYTLLFSLLTIALCLGVTSEVNLIVILLPITLLVSSLILRKLFVSYSKSLVFNLFLLQCFFRYLLFPVFLIFSPNTINYIDTDYFGWAIVFMSIELCFVFVTFFVFQFKHNRYLMSAGVNVRYVQSNVFLLLLLFLMLMYIYSSGALSKVNFIWNLSDYIEQTIDNGQSLEYGTLGMLLFLPFKALIFLFFISRIGLSSFRDTTKSWLMLLVVIGSTLVITGSSRFSMVLNFLVLLWLVRLILGDKTTKGIVVLAASSLVVALFAATIAKFSRYGNSMEIGDILSASSINAYFAGPRNISIGLIAYENVKGIEHFLFMLNDTLQNIPILSKVTIASYKTNVVFNELIYGHRDWADQIVPLSVSGIFHFGYIGAFLYAPVFIGLALYMERKARVEEFIAYKYVFLYLTIVFSLVFMLNLGSMYAALTRTMLFVFLPFWLLNQYEKVKKRRR